MKYKINLSHNIKLINKRYNNEFYHYIAEPNNVLIIPVFKKNFLLVMQKRIPIKSLNYEFPMGWIDKGETPLDASSRELLEETGFRTVKRPKKLLSFYADPGRGSRTCYCYFSDCLKKIKTPEKNIRVYLKSKKQIESLIKSKKFNNSMHIAAFYYYLNKF